MAYYSDEVIEEVRSANDIVDVISQYVTLKRNGRNFKGLCPFHKEKTPSFSVSADKQIFHCFGCGVGGNVIHFISKIEGLDFRDTLEFLAERAGITLQSVESAQDTKLQQLKSRIYNINLETANFYHENLYKPTAKIAQEYVKKRKLDNKTLKAFLIGFSCNYDELYKYLKSKGYTDEELIASNLVLKNENNQFIDRFRKRLMFPILDIRNKVIAFGGRKLDDTYKEVAKYINTSENAVYSKGRNLFGLNIAKNSNSKKIIIVEGYMDAISLHQRGITNAVASLGTALTESQGRLLRKYSEEVIISYDSDAAGQGATMRGLEILHNLGCNLRILQMEGAKDPDEYVIQHGSAGYNELVDNAISLVEFKVKVLRKQLNVENTIDKIKFLNEIAKILSTVTNKIEQEIYIEKIANEYQISKEAIYAEVNKLGNVNRVSVKTLTNSPVIRPKKVENVNTEKREDLIIKLLVNEKQKVYSQIKEYIQPEDIKNELERKIVQKLYDDLEKGNNNEDILKLFEEEDEINKVTAVMAENYEFVEIDKGVKDLIKTYEQEKLTDKRNEIIEKLKDSTLTKEMAKELEGELSSIIVKLAKIR